MMDLTLREWAAFARGARRREEEAWRRTVWGAWHAAGWGKFAKRMPNYERLLRRMKLMRTSPRQTPAQHLQIAERLNAMFGGRKSRKEG